MTCKTRFNPRVSALLILTSVSTTIGAPVVKFLPGRTSASCSDVGQPFVEIQGAPGDFGGFTYYTIRLIEADWLGDATLVEI